MAEKHRDATLIKPTDRELVFERIFDAPRPLVFEAFSKPEHLTQWWGPTGWTLPVCQMDFRPGGTWLFCMRGPDGEEAWGKARYHEIVPPERIVYTDSFCDPDGNDLPGMPLMLMTMEFVEYEGQTKLITRTKFDSTADLDQVVKMGMVEGLNQTWNRLADYLPDMAG